ncbi:MAG TPA: styrene monooxygenase/indole monooxygenase family protein [bacterium]|nr:styrene monooxygenase/indole monooxygenase family protein [bacterium]
MRRITIIGAGQAGLLLGLGLLKDGYDVTLVSDRTPDEIRDGAVMSTQALFGDSLQIEREMGLALWDKKCPEIAGVSFKLAGPDGGKALAWSAPFEAPAQSVDQRLKMPAYLNKFLERGGDLIVKKADLKDLENFAALSDLIVVATGKGELGSLFERDAERSPYDRPQRSLAVCYVHKMKPDPAGRAVDLNIIPGVGEYVVIPGLTKSGPCDQMFFEGLPGGPFDAFQDVRSSEEHLEQAKSLLKRFVPWQAERCGDAALADADATLRGRFAPTVRKPIGKLPSGKLVLGLADAVVLNDPITGQGANNAVKCADLYRKRIVERGDRPFDAGWMQETFDLYWDYARWVTTFTNTMLQPPSPHLQKILGAAASQPKVAHRFVNSFIDPKDFFPWLTDAAAADRFLAEHAS